MKTFLRGAVAAIALAASAGVANAQTNTRHYAGTFTIDLPTPLPDFTINGAINNPQNATVFGIPVGGILTPALDAIVENSQTIGTRYTAVADAPSDSTPATPVVTVAFNLTGSVNRDCSFYSGNDASARNIDFGVIGIRTGNNENVNQAFEMVGDATATIETLTAGCNFNNVVSMSKGNVLGLVNAAQVGYDQAEFQANIPYEVTATWTGVATQSGPAAGTTQTLPIAANQLSNSIAQGAWRSDFTIEIEAPVVDKGLVAGTYSDTLTLALNAS